MHVSARIRKPIKLGTHSLDNILFGEAGRHPVISNKYSVKLPFVHQGKEFKVAYFGYKRTNKNIQFQGAILLDKNDIPVYMNIFQDIHLDNLRGWAVAIMENNKYNIVSLSDDKVETGYLYDDFGIYDNGYLEVYKKKSGWGVIDSKFKEVVKCSAKYKKFDDKEFCEKVYQLRLANYESLKAKGKKKTK